MSGTNLQRVIFFDVDDTLIFFDPDPLDLLREKALEMGIGDFSQENVQKAFKTASPFYFGEGLKYVQAPIELFTLLNAIILKELGVTEKRNYYARVIAEYTETLSLIHI